MASNLHTPTRNQEAYWVSILFASLAVLLAFGPLQYESPVAPATPVSDSATAMTPVRQPTLRPLYQVGAFKYECRECHRSSPTPNTAGHEFTKHTDIHLAHGINTRCLNCHHPTNREVFVDDFGGEIPWDQPQLVCAKCHGPVYRDWQHGSHGRINGYWDKSRGEQVRLKCIACHDPHHPPFQPLASTPPPHTLRMTPPSDSPHAGVRNPLRLTDTQSAADHAGHANREVDDE